MRPTLGDIWDGTAFIACDCGAILQSGDAVACHIERGHFDYDTVLRELLAACEAALPALKDAARDLAYHGTNPLPIRRAWREIDAAIAAARG